MDTIEAIMSRRSVRRFEADRGLDAGTVETLMRAAMAAPSAGNQQPWRFVVVTDDVMLSRLAAATPYASALLSAPLGIVVLGDERELKWPGYWVQDCSAATQNILLAAHALGLGAVWLGVHPDEERETAVAEVLGLEQGVTPLCMIAVGHPEQRPAPADRYEAGFVRENTWS